MKSKLWLPLTIAALALAGVSTLFVATASPYVSVESAKSTRGDRLHLKGSIVAGTVFPNPKKGTVSFTLKDDLGKTMPVKYFGAPPANMGTATEVVAIGKVNGETFHAQELLLKCPSKYEAEPKA